MTVRELREKLQAFQDDLPVYAEGDGGLYAISVGIETIPENYVLIFPLPPEAGKGQPGL